MGQDFQKRSILHPQRKFLPSAKWEKSVLIIVFVLGHPKGVGELIFNFPHGTGIDIFLEWSIIYDTSTGTKLTNFLVWNIFTGYNINYFNRIIRHTVIAAIYSTTLSKKKSRPKSDLGRHLSTFFTICSMFWSTSNHAFTNHWKLYNWNVTSSQKIQNPNFISRRAKFDLHEVCYESNSIADFLTAISTKSLTLAELSSAKICRLGGFIGRQMPTSFSRAVDRMYILDTFVA